MKKIKLELEKLIPKRIELARQFFLSQQTVPRDRKAFDTRLRGFAKESKQSTLRNDELLEALHGFPDDVQNTWRRLCRKRGIRSESGVAVVAILTRAYGCPGRCVYCPTPAKMPKSYLPNEPAVMRAIHAHFSPALQITNRIKALKATGHDPSKVEIIVLGGTWSALPQHYQTQYIRSCYYALNAEKRPMKSLEEEQTINESAPHRCIGLTLETRPDWINEKELRKMRRYGCTRIEVGVQSLNDDVQKITKRGHGKDAVIAATKLMRDSGFKVVYHMMLNLPGSSPEEDIAMFKELFSNPAYCPDQVKIYPCVLTKNTELVEWFQDGRWKPYTDEELASTIIAIKKFIPEYCRVIRVIRDIPSSDIIAGSQISNLRQLLQEKGMQCRCIRCREIRNREIMEIKLMRKDYDAAGGKEIFLSFEDPSQDALLALLRVRLPSSAAPIFPALKDAALIRELHVYGMHTPVGEEGASAQHFGLGKKLLEAAETIVKNEGRKKIAIISGIGVRDYYRKLGYKLEDGYMVKEV